jgi:heme-degrading monooxygenase HmoA
MMSLTRHPSIARIWRGRVPRARADEYERYLREAGIPPLEKTALAVQLLREDRERESEFVTISYWADVQDMSAFTGGDPNVVHHLARDEEFLLELPKRIEVLRIVVDTR